MANNVQNPLELNPTVGGKQYAAGISKTKMQSLVDALNMVGDPNRLNQLEDWGNIADEATLRNMLSDENNLSKEHTQRISFNCNGNPGFAIVNYIGNNQYYEQYTVGSITFARTWTVGESSSKGWAVVSPLLLKQNLLFVENTIVEKGLQDMPKAIDYGLVDSAKEFEDWCALYKGDWGETSVIRWYVGTNNTNNCTLLMFHVRGNDVTIDGVTHKRYTQYYFLNGNLYTRNVDSEDGATAWHQVTLDGWRLRTATNSRGQKELQLYNGNYLSGAVLVSDLTADVTSALSAAVTRIATLETKAATLETKAAALETKAATLESKVAALEAKMAQVDTILQDLIVSDSSTNNTNNDNNN